jgi:hypothetical protein
LNALNTRSLTVIGYASAIYDVFLAWNAADESIVTGSGSARHDIRFPNRRIALCPRTRAGFPTAIEPAGIDHVTIEPCADDAAVPDLHAADKDGVVADERVARAWADP